ncbi:MAG TPA: hypothetical protein VNU64_25210, partial [Burkholderiales bacterium]|nr:hypothetical protein [Burkholderiales bacterium]
VWDYARERGGYVRASQVRQLALVPEEAPELLAILRFLRGVPGSEALGIGFAAAYIEAASPETLNGPDGVEALDAMGAMAERLARAASGASSLKAVMLSSHLDVAARYGVRFLTVERNGRVRLCYDGAAYRKVLVMHATEEQRARAMLALSDPACLKPQITLAQLLDAEVPSVPAYVRNRLLMRRASLWASVAYQQARKGGGAAEAAERAAAALEQVDTNELAESDRVAYSDAQLRVNASRVALMKQIDGKQLRVATVAGDKGQTCAELRNAKDQALAKRCTYGHVWAASAVANRESTALALAVQPTDSWRELWVFRKSAKGWSVRVVPPAAAQPGVGTAEFAGWETGKIRVTREAIVGGRVVRSTAQVRLDAAGTKGKTRS